MGGEIRVSVLRPLDEIAEIRRESTWWFAAGALIGLLLISLLVIGLRFFQATRKHADELTELNGELARLAATDPLTGCANRRHMLQVLESERLRWERYSSPFCVLSLDLDHFKAVNDVHGHLAGDEVLRHFVSLVQKVLRPTDLLGRMGGEEFAVFLPETKGDEAAAIAERIRTTVEASPARLEGTEIPLTVSIGFTQWRADDDQSIEDFLYRSDKALYAAKAGGRDRVQGDVGEPPRADAVP
jgi:diguanylate cyclase (GGDEF)-like protein